MKSRIKQFTNSHLDQRQISAAIRDAKKELREMCSNLFSGKVAFKYENQICTGVPIDFHRCLSEWAQSSSIDFAIRNIILSSFYSTDVVQGGSGLISCLFWVGLLSVEDNSNQRKTRARKNDVDNVIESWSRGGMSSSIAKKLICLGACGSEVELKEGQQYATVVKTIQGKKIIGSIDPLFASRVSLGDETSYCVVAIDGFVESVSQIHRVLEASEKQSVVIMARGFFPDVSNTLAESWISRGLRVIPFTATDWGVANFLSLEKSGFECVSNESGGQIQNARLQNPINMTVFENYAIYQNSDCQSSKLIVSFGKDLAALKGLSIDRTKMLISLGRFAARSGVLNVTIEESSLHIPMSSYVAAIRAEQSLQNVLQNLGCVIVSKKRRKNVESIRRCCL